MACFRGCHGDGGGTMGVGLGRWQGAQGVLPLGVPSALKNN